MILTNNFSTGDDEVIDGGRLRTIEVGDVEQGG